MKDDSSMREKVSSSIPSLSVAVYAIHHIGIYVIATFKQVAKYMMNLLVKHRKWLK